MIKSHYTRYFLYMLLPIINILGIGTHAQASPSLSIYGSLPGVEGAVISPSGDYIAMVADDGTGRKLIVMDKDRKPQQAVPLGDAKVRGVTFAGDKIVLLEKSVTSNLGIGFRVRTH